MIPPSIMRIRVREKGKHNISLWLPLFLLWPIIIVFTAILLPFLIIAAIVFWNKYGKQILKSIPVFYSLICAMRGTLINVDSGAQKVYIGIW